MPLLIPVNSAAVTVPLKHSALARSAVITFGVNTNSDSNGQDMVNILQANVATFLNGLVDSEVTIGPTVMRRNEGVASEPHVYVAASTNVGGRSGESQPPNVALLIHKVTGRGGRAGRGRMFIPWGLAESEVVDVGTLTSAAVTKVNTALAAFIDEMEGDDLPLLLFHNEGTAGGDEPNQITSMRCDPRVGTQRRRMGR